MSEMPDGASNLPEGGSIFRVTINASYAGRTRQHKYVCTWNGGEKTWTQFLLDISTTLVTYTMFDRSADVLTLFWFYEELFPNPVRAFPVPWPLNGFWFEPPVSPSKIAVVSLNTGLPGPKNRGRKFLFGLPESFVEGNYLTPIAVERLSARFSSLAEQFSEENTEWPYTWGVFHRYVGGVKLLPFPTNYWPWKNMIVKSRLVNHQSMAISRRA